MKKQINLATRQAEIPVPLQNTGQTGGGWGILSSLNDSKYFAGLMMILLNLGSKYLSLELSQTQESILGNPIIRRLLIFTVVFTATRDVWISILMTAAFIILVSGLFNEESRYCILPRKVHKYSRHSKNITKPSAEDVEKAKQILQLAQQQARPQGQISEEQDQVVVKVPTSEARWQGIVTRQNHKYERNWDLFQNSKYSRW